MLPDSPETSGTVVSGSDVHPLWHACLSICAFPSFSRLPPLGRRPGGIDNNRDFRFDRLDDVAHFVIEQITAFLTEVDEVADLAVLFLNR